MWASPVYWLLEGSVYPLIEYRKRWELDTGVSEVSEAWDFLKILQSVISLGSD